ncbi:MAG TPA: hypothetical protein VF552_00710 [Allosphingosinicella sp.]|jgi:hypothetical protein
MLHLRFLRSWAVLAAGVLAFLMPAAAPAAVEMTFYSREFGSQFPHGFVVLQGTPDRGGERIDTNYGFTATAVSPAILFGSVRGKVEAVGGGYIRDSEAHLRLTLTDAEYDRVMETVARWRDARQPSYSLSRRNCVHFIADIAAALGMQADVPRHLTRRPTGWTESLIRRNRAWIAARADARILKEPGPEREERRRGRNRDAQGAEAAAGDSARD